MKVKTTDDAWNVQEQYKDKPHGWIQWKGAHLCIDIHCECGVLTHVDGEFLYHVKCGECGRVYYCNGHIQLIELEVEPDNCVSITSK